MYFISAIELHPLFIKPFLLLCLQPHQPHHQQQQPPHRPFRGLKTFLSLIKKVPTSVVLLAGTPVGLADQEDHHL